MNDFISLRYIGDESEICVRKSDIYYFRESIFELNDTNKLCTQVYLLNAEHPNIERSILVKETPAEIMEMLEHE